FMIEMMNEKGEQKNNEIEELKKIINEYKDTLQRLQADFENSRKRLEREKQEFLELAGLKVIEDFLPLIDSLTSAIESAEKSGNTEMKLGLEKILRQAKIILARHGVEEIPCKGKFDIRFHDCIMTEKVEDKEDNEILEEIQKGYVINGKVIRPAKVKVNKIGETESDKNE
ncbi:MAG: nucleotide exchange factor GrpE, partial [Candidatus Diapherotrites archaeon]